MLSYESITVGRPGNPYWRERLCTVDLHMNIGCFTKQKNIVLVWESTDPNKLVQGGQLYGSFPFNKDSVVEKLTQDCTVKGSNPAPAD